MRPAGTPDTFWGLLPDLVRRELANRFTASQTGWLWVIATPLLLLAVYSFVFGVIFRARVPDGLDIPFVMWLAVALWPWLAFSEGVLRGSQSIVQHAALISKVPMPRALPVVASVSAVFILHGCGFLVVLLTLELLGFPLYWQGSVGALAALVTLYAFALGLALIAAAVQVFLRDLEQALPTLFMLWFFLTPILYAPQMLPEGFRRLPDFNPMTWWMGQIRDTLLGGHWFVPLPFVVTLALAALTLWLGYKVFHRLSPHFEDFL